MLSVGRIRELLGNSGRPVEDSQVEELREQLYTLAEHIVGAARGSVARERAARVESWDLLAPDLRAEIHERAAIMEFEGELPQEVAERRAFEIVCGRKEEGSL